MNAQVQRIIAEQNLLIAHQQEKTEQRERDVQTLRELRHTLKATKARYATLAALHAHATEDHNAIQAQLGVVSALLENSLLVKPRIAHILPDDDEVILWSLVHTRLEAERTQLVMRLRAIVRIDRVEAVQMANAVQQIEFSVQNLTNKLDETSGRSLPDGVSGVS